MNNDMTTALTQAAVLTFEELGFLLPDLELSDEQKAACGEALVKISFQGPFQGELVVRLYGGVLPELAANMLGEMEPPLPEVQHDAFGEIGNVICGNALPSIAGSREVFHLGTPEVERFCGPSTRQPSAEVTLGLQAGRAEVALFVH